MADGRKHYNWDKLLSYMSTADVAMLVGGRNIGKTFGCRLRGFNRWAKTGLRMAAIVRHDNHVVDVLNGYFDKIKREGYLENWKFARKGRCLYASMIEPVKGERIKDELMLYGVSLSKEQDAKELTFVNVGWVIMDEAILRRDEPWKRYLNNEYIKFVNLLSTLYREDETAASKGKAFLLANALDLVNPYFQEVGINTVPDYGFHWYKNKSFLLHYIESGNTEESKQNTIVGRLLSGEESSVIFDNKFVDATEDFIASKSANAKFRWALVFRGQSFGVWVDIAVGITYINRQIPAHSDAYTLALTLPDNRLDYDMILKADERLKMISRLYRNGYVRFDTPATRVCFYEVLKYLGMN